MAILRHEQVYIKQQENIKREREVRNMSSIISEPYQQMCLYMCVMVDQHEALAVTTRLTDKVYFGSPYRDSTVNLWISKQQPCILPLSYLVLG